MMASSKLSTGSQIIKSRAGIKKVGSERTISMMLGVERKAGLGESLEAELRIREMKVGLKSFMEAH